MKFGNGIDMLSQKIVNLADPSAATDAVTKQYADALMRGAKLKDPVRAASTTNGTLATAFANGSVIDGVTLATGDRILIKNQSSGAENGIYTVNVSGAPTRAVDANTTGQLAPGSTVYVTEGTNNADKAFSITSDAAITIGTTATTWGQTGGAGSTYTNGNGLSLSGGSFSVLAAAGGGISVNGSGVSIDTTLVARKYSANVGNGSLTSIPVTHNLGTKDVQVSIRANADDSMILTDWVATDTNTVTLIFATAPASNAYRTTITG